MFPASAGAVQLVNPDGSVAQPYQGWADLSAVPTVSGSISMTMDLRACPGDDTIVACIRPSAAEMFIDGHGCGLTGRTAWRRCRFTVMHELGHAFEFQMPAWKRARFLAIVRSADPWDAAAGEYFADSYAMCSMRNIYPVEEIEAPDITHRQFRRICHLIRIPN